MRSDMALSAVFSGFKPSDHTAKRRTQWARQRQHSAAAADGRASLPWPCDVGRHEGHFLRQSLVWIATPLSGIESAISIRLSTTASRPEATRACFDLAGLVPVPPHR
jgi:hypothetical protein